MAATYKIYKDDNNELIYLEIGSAEQVAADANPQLTEILNPIDASQVSDIGTAVSNSETVTNLQIIGNTLRFTNEAGVDQDIDLTTYLDDTNLARIESGTLDAGTGIATFTRDDLSTFTIDLSSLLDNQDASEVPVTPSGNLTSTDVQAALEEHQADIDSLTSADAGLQTQISNNDTDISNLQSEQTTQNTNISNNATAISNNTAAISSNDTDISNLQTEQSTQNTNISNNASDIAILNASQTTQDAAIALNTAKVSADGSVGTHSDVDLTTVAPMEGDQLVYESGQFVPKSIDNGFTIFPIWAEENGGLADNQYEWSWGNGATGAAIGIPVAFDCELFAVSFNAETFGTSVSIDTEANGAILATTNFTTNNEVINISPVQVSAGDRIGFRTNTVVGGMDDCRVCAWFRVSSTALFPTPDRSVVSNSNVAFTAGSFATIPGLSTTVTINDTGTIDGTLIYSAARSGGTNSEAEFRVVINGTNGLSFQDTLSTFNDTGSAAFFLSGLPAGTYTVEAQGQVSEPITIASCQLTAVGVED